MMRRRLWLSVVLVGAALSAALFWRAGRGAPPVLQIVQPAAVIGEAGTLEVTAEAPGARFTTLTIALEQQGRTIRLFSWDAREGAAVQQDTSDRVRISRPIGKRSIPELAAGTARITVSAARPAFLGLRQIAASTAREVTVRLEPPRIAVLSTRTYVNHGGSELVVYRAAPPGVRSGVRVGAIEYPGYPASGAGVASADPTLHVAFFALLDDQDLKAPIVAFARDEAGNEARATFVDNVFEKPVKRSRIELDDRFIQRVVPEILSHSPDLKPPPEGGDLLPAFLEINGELRRRNAEAIAAMAARTSPRRLWEGPFVQLGNSQVEASFADHRTYFYRGKEVDAQVHLGFDLAVTANVPVVAANAGSVLHASYLGIYGNCIIIDHGMGVQSLYGHLSAFDVKVGDQVAKGQTIARSGMTGLAAGDHLHFTVLVGGHPVTPVEWWDPHWIADRIERKLREAGAAEPPPSRLSSLLAPGTRAPV